MLRDYTNILLMIFNLIQETIQDLENSNQWFVVQKKNRTELKFAWRYSTIVIGQRKMEISRKRNYSLASITCPFLFLYKHSMARSPERRSRNRSSDRHGSSERRSRHRSRSVDRSDRKRRY
jgi:hypothetical protein